MIRLLIADDHHIVREGLKKILAFEDDIILVGEANSAETLLPMLEDLRPDVLLLDISMPGRSGLDVLPDVRRISENTRVLMLTMHPEEMHAMRSLRAGASGYLTKDAIPSELPAAVRRIHAGRRYITPDMAERLVSELTQLHSDDPLDLLSMREHEVLRLLAQGDTPASIAEQLHISPRTVGTYRRRILLKLQLENTADMIRFALSHGLI
ncbi:MAG: response regulator transcription factor [Bacteroidetes bacterium]|nr:response regulator transcription factor [Bacteroidota bacterium]